MSGFDFGLEEFNQGVKSPSDIEVAHYLFWEKGISLQEFDELPVPYILSVLQTWHWVKEREAQASKKKK